MAFPTLIGVVATAALLVTAAQAGDVPTLNVRPTCTPIGDDKTFPIDTKRCLKTEQETRDQLVRQWANFPAADRSLCTQTATMGGLPSYVALITCLEMKRDAAALSTDGAFKTKPTGLSQKNKPAVLPGQK